MTVVRVSDLYLPARARFLFPILASCFRMNVAGVWITAKTSLVSFANFMIR